MAQWLSAGNRGPQFGIPVSMLSDSEAPVTPAQEIWLSLLATMGTARMGIYTLLNTGIYKHRYMKIPFKKLDIFSYDNNWTMLEMCYMYVYSRVILTGEL